MVDKIRNKETVSLNNFGRAAKILNADEAKFRPIFRKSLMAAQDIKSGTEISSDMVFAMRPQVFAKGLPSEEYENIIGKTIKKGLKKFDPITWDVIQNGQKRKICFVITSKIHYSRNKIMLEELRNRDDVELQIVVGASAILEKYGDVLTLLEEDGFDYNAKITMTLEGGSPISMAKTTGIGITEFATIFDNLAPDIVVVRGDRYEVLSAAIAAAYLNITVAHIEGGDLSGTIDESVRHAITKLSHIHFATNEPSRNRLLRMGEDPKHCFDVGAIDVEFVAKHDQVYDPNEINQIGVGKIIDTKKSYIIVMQHPVTTEMGDNEKNIIETIKAIKNTGIQTIWFWPNVDAGTDEISGALRRYRELYNLDEYVRIIKYLPPERFIALLKDASCLVGNSSSGLKECSYLGTPVVNIGTRQSGRMRSENVIDVDYNKEDIESALKKQLEHGKYNSSKMYYKENTGKNIAEILASTNLYIQKKFVE
ncbi:UDP-N-acetylglucosamine 2-epimerase, partial [Patescibacteria group bacterium]